MKRLILVLALLAIPNLARAQQAELVEYYAQDAIGSIRVVFDVNGVSKARQDYEPFGRPLFPAAATAKEGFGAQEKDDESNQAYFHARLFESRTGRFTRVDPIFAGLFQPQAWNRYAYALNNPETLVDPDGQMVMQDCVKTALVINDYQMYSCQDTSYAFFQSGQSTGNSGGLRRDPPGKGTGNPTDGAPTDGTPPNPPPGPNPPPQTCTSTSKASSSWINGVGADYLMFTSWLQGTGPTDYEFAAGSNPAQQMSDAYGLLQHVNDFANGGPAAGHQDFGLSGLWYSGLNPMQQFAGSYNYAFTRTGNTVNATITNTTTAWSFFYHAPGLDPNPPTRSGFMPMGRVNQTYHVVITCK